MASGMVIGLDVGTSAVRAVAITPGTPPRLHLMGQVPLPDGAVKEGEVVDPSAVAACLRTLWKEVGFKGRSVRLSIASARVIVRPVDMPLMSDGDTRAALGFQLADFIPMPPDQTVFDFQPLEADEENAQQQVLLAAAARDAVQPLIDAVKQAGLRVDHLDVTASVLARMVPPSPSTEAVVSVGAGMIVVVVVHDGQPVFARTLTNVSGRHITDRIATELSISVADAERLKRHLPDGTPPDMAAGVLLATDPFVTEITSEIADSLDYFTAQPGGRRVDALTLTGGGSLLTGVRERLGRRLGVPVDLADPFARVTMDLAALAQADAPALAPFMALALGTALGVERGRAKQINLKLGLARPRLPSRNRVIIGGVVAALVIGAVYGYTGQSSAISAAKADQSQAERAVAAAQAVAASRTVAGGPSTGYVTSAAAVLAYARVGDVDWTSVTSQLDAISEPLGVNLSSVTGTARVASPVAVAKPATTTASSTGAAAATTTTVPAASVGVGAVGSLKLAGRAPDLNVVAAWIDAVVADDRFDTAWVDSASVAAGTSGFNFTATVMLSAKNVVARNALQAAAS